LQLRGFLFLFGCLVLLAACGGGDEEAQPTGVYTGAPTAGLPPPGRDRSDNPIKVVVTLPFMADVAHIVGGNQVTVTTLIPPGQDPHTYVPPADLADEVEAAEIIFYNGLGFEAPSQRFIEQHLAGRPPMVIDIVRNVPSPSTQQPLDRPIYATARGDDPHLFLDPALAHVYAETISHTFIIADGLNSSYYDSRYRAYRDQITEVNDATKERIAGIPEADRVLVTQHNSLVWFAKRYGLTIGGTLADDGESGLRDRIASLKPRAVFTEVGYDPAPLTALAGEAGIPVCSLQTDNIATAETNYLKMLEALGEEITRCLTTG
jgi:ABC-type Zn uptake system ZnuABC Zn-binding protein ZnuA